MLSNINSEKAYERLRDLGHTWDYEISNREPGDCDDYADFLAQDDNLTDEEKEIIRIEKERRRKEDAKLEAYYKSLRADDEEMPF